MNQIIYRLAGCREGEAPLLVVVSAAHEEGRVEPAGEARVGRGVVARLAPPAQLVFGRGCGGRGRGRGRGRHAGIHGRSWRGVESGLSSAGGPGR